MMSGGGYGAGVESSRAAATRLQQKRQRYETTSSSSSSSSSSTDGLMLGGNYNRTMRADREFELGQPPRRTVILEENHPNSMMLVDLGLLVQQDARAKQHEEARLAQEQQRRHRKRPREAESDPQFPAVDNPILVQMQEAERAEPRRPYQQEETQMRARHEEARLAQRAQSARYAELANRARDQRDQSARYAELANRARDQRDQWAQLFESRVAEVASFLRQRPDLLAQSQAQSARDAEFAAQERDQRAQLIQRQIAEFARLLGFPAQAHDQRAQRRGRDDGDLSEEVISKHLKSRVRPSREEQDKDEMCTVCLDDLGNEKINGDGIVTLDCRHEYHYSCIEQWLHRKNVCPLCNRRAINIII